MAAMLLVGSFLITIEYRCNSSIPSGPLEICPVVNLSASDTASLIEPPAATIRISLNLANLRRLIVSSRSRGAASAYAPQSLIRYVRHFFFFLFSQLGVIPSLPLRKMRGEGRSFDECRCLYRIVNAYVVDVDV